MHEDEPIEQMGYLNKNTKPYGVNMSEKSLRLSWNSSNDVDRDIDVSSIAVANLCGMRRFTTCKLLQLRTLTYTGLWTFPNERFVFLFSMM